MVSNLKTNEHEVTMAEAVPMLELLTDNSDPVMLWGAPGIGKTSVVYQLGARRNRNVIMYKTNVREPVDVRGVPVPDLKTGTTRWLVPNELPQVERDGEFGYLLIDEINTCTEQMMAVMMGLILERRVGEYELPPGWVVIATGNRVTDRAAARRMPTALRNRLAHIFITPDVDALASYWNKTGVAPELIAFIRLRRELIHVMPKGDENAFPTPRSLEKCGKYINADKKIRMRLFATHIGDATASELDGFIELYHSIGTLDDIVANPDGANVPTEPSLRYAVCTGLGRIATRKTFPNIIKFAKRLPRESQILLVTDATERDPSLKETAAYGKYAVENQDLHLQ